MGRDVSVTGFDDLPAAGAAGLTTVRQPIRDKGRLMASMLLEPGFDQRRVVLATQLIVRDSTGSAPPRGEKTRVAMGDEWNVGALDLSAYLDRISYHGPAAPPLRHWRRCTGRTSRRSRSRTLTSSWAAGCPLSCPTSRRS